MKALACVGLLCFSFAAHASEALLVPVSTPAPRFPSDLLRKRHPGKVLVNLTVSAYGTVQAARIIESSHPKFTEAAQRAVVKWRFKPWEVTEGKPSSVDIAVPMIFGARGLQPFSPQITVGLENTLCAYLNHEVQASKRDFPTEPLSEVDVFWQTRAYLAGSYVAHLRPDQRKRETLIDELYKAIPAIVKSCQSNAEDKYGEYLPESIRSLLVSASEQ